MAMQCTAPSCEAWKEKLEETKAACGEQRYFDAVQIVNAALDAFEALPEMKPLSTARPGVMVTEPQRFVEECGSSMSESSRSGLAEIYAMRADVLMNLGGMARATGELSAAAALAPQSARVKELQIECEELKEVQAKGFAESKALEGKAKIPAHMLTGFLGSGKTTLLNHILEGSHGKKYAVIENEFGEIGIDDALIATRENLGAEQIIEMNNGCICCTVRGDLIKGLKTILKRSAANGTTLDGVLIETTGLADPAPVAQTFFADTFIQARMVLDGIITLVDAKHLLQHLHEEKPEGVENEAVEQLAFADRILLNKIDLVNEAALKEVEAEIRKINAFAPIIRTQQSQVDLEQILGIKGFSLDRVLEAEPEFLNDDQEHQHDASVSSVGIECPGECELEKLNLWIGKLLKEKGVDIFRTKGILVIKGSNSPFVFQGIHMIFGGSPQGEWKPGANRVNKLVFIGRNLNREELETGFKGVLAPQ